MSRDILGADGENRLRITLEAAGVVVNIADPYLPKGRMWTGETEDGRRVRALVIFVASESVDGQRNLDERLPAEKLVLEAAEAALLADRRIA